MKKYWHKKIKSFIETAKRTKTKTNEGETKTQNQEKSKTKTEPKEWKNERNGKELWYHHYYCVRFFLLSATSRHMPPKLGHENSFHLHRTEFCAAHTSSRSGRRGEEQVKKHTINPYRSIDYNPLPPTNASHTRHSLHHLASEDSHCCIQQ